MPALKGAFINMGAGLLGVLPNIVVFQFNPLTISRSRSASIWYFDGSGRPAAVSAMPCSSTTETLTFGGARWRIGWVGPRPTMPSTLRSRSSKATRW